MHSIVHGRLVPPESGGGGGGAAGAHPQKPVAASGNGLVRGGMCPPLQSPTVQSVVEISRRYALFLISSLTYGSLV